MRDDLEPLDYVRLLHEREHFTDGVNVLARLFTKREVVWWACQSTRQTMTKSELARARLAAIEATEAWVADSTEENRRPLFALSQSAGLDNGAGCAALAAFGSGGSMAPPEYDPILPIETMTSDLSSASVLLAGMGEEPEKALEKYGLFLQQGIALYEQREQSA